MIWQTVAISGWITLGTLMFWLVVGLPPNLFSTREDQRASAIMFGIAGPIGITIVIMLLLVALIDPLLKSDRFWKRFEK